MTKRPACDDALVLESPQPSKKQRLIEPSDRGVTTKAPEQPGQATKGRKRPSAVLNRFRWEVEEAAGLPTYTTEIDPDDLYLSMEQIDLLRGWKSNMFHLYAEGCGHVVEFDIFSTPEEVHQGLQRHRDTDCVPNDPPRPPKRARASSANDHADTDDQPRPSKRARVNSSPPWVEEMLARRREPVPGGSKDVRYWPEEIMLKGPQGWYPDPRHVEIILRKERGLECCEEHQRRLDRQEHYRQWRLAKTRNRLPSPSPDDGDDEGPTMGYFGIVTDDFANADENGVSPEVLDMQDDSEERIAEVFGQDYARWWFNRQRQAREAARAPKPAPKSVAVQAPDLATVQAPTPTTAQASEPAAIRTPEPATIQAPEPVSADKRRKPARKSKRKTLKRKTEEQKKKKETQKGKRTPANMNLQQDDRVDLPDIATARRLTRQSRTRAAAAAIFYELDQRGKVRRA